MFKVTEYAALKVGLPISSFTVSGDIKKKIEKKKL